MNGLMAPTHPTDELDSTMADTTRAVWLAVWAGPGLGAAVRRRKHALWGVRRVHAPGRSRM